MRPIAAALSVVPLLAACTQPTPQDRQAALQPLVGQSETDLVRRMGVPTRSVDVDGHRFLAYLQRDVTVLPGLGLVAAVLGRLVVSRPRRRAGSRRPRLRNDIRDYRRQGAVVPVARQRMRLTNCCYIATIWTCICVSSETQFLQ